MFLIFGFWLIPGLWESVLTLCGLLNIFRGSAFLAWLAGMFPAYVCWLCEAGIIGDFGERKVEGEDICHPLGVR